MSQLMLIISIKDGEKMNISYRFFYYLLIYLSGVIK